MLKVDSVGYILLFCNFVVGLVRAGRLPLNSTYPEVYMNVSEIIRFYGYPCEEHAVTTEDGYILSLQRIPHGRNVSTGPSKPVAFLQHGLLDSAHTWINNRPQQSLAFILADGGFDVWLANSRGNTYSNKHVNLDVLDSRFWDFSFDEMAQYDLPASIEYVLRTSNISKISYVGHSQGTLIAFAQLPQNSTLRSKISSFVALGPVAYVSYVEAALRLLAKFRNGVEIILQLFGHGRFLTSNDFFRFIATTLCAEVVMRDICSEAIFLFAGYDLSNLNQTRLPVYIAHTPAGTSIKNVVHYAQCVDDKKFQKFDFGYAENMQHYGTPNPPQYLLKGFDIPSAFFSGAKDVLADPTDVHALLSELRGVVKSNYNISYYNHMDFVWGEDAYTKIYPKILEFMKQHL